VRLETLGFEMPFPGVSETRREKLGDEEWETEGVPAALKLAGEWVSCHDSERVLEALSAEALREIDVDTDKVAVVDELRDLSSVTLEEGLRVEPNDGENVPDCSWDAEEESVPPAETESVVDGLELLWGVEGLADGLTLPRDRECGVDFDLVASVRLWDGERVVVGETVLGVLFEPRVNERDSVFVLEIRLAPACRRMSVAVSVPFGESDEVCRIVMVLEALGDFESRVSVAAWDREADSDFILVQDNEAE
jgi:hypothetical protein